MVMPPERSRKRWPIASTMLIAKPPTAAVAGTCRPKRITAPIEASARSRQNSNDRRLVITMNGPATALEHAGKREHSRLEAGHPGAQVWCVNCGDRRGSCHALRRELDHGCSPALRRAATTAARLHLLGTSSHEPSSLVLLNAVLSTLPAALRGNPS